VSPGLVARIGKRVLDWRSMMTPNAPGTAAPARQVNGKRTNDESARLLASAF